jgi:thiol-disulfide isomerase/thioredoxin
LGQQRSGRVIPDLRSDRCPTRKRILICAAKVVIIDFWATWCQSCKKEMPGYQKLVDRYGSQGLAVVEFKFDAMMDREDPVLFAKKIGVRYPLAVADDDLKQKFGGIEGLPTTMLYSTQIRWPQCIRSR